ncbi:MAG: ThuA domain-containing protein [Phycisphaerales bacterium]|nr:MAG: ThuA domain-containing protein [Phycisphaerales bacterium]
MSLLTTLGPPAAVADLPPDLVEKIEAALPAKATAVPQRDRTVLIFSFCKGFQHGAIPCAAHTLKRLGEKTGAYEPVVSDDVTMFRPENLTRFDAVIFNNTTGTLFDDPTLKDSLLQFVRNGKGIVGVHAATDCFYDWAEFGEMMGGYFDGHPWNEEVTVKVDDPGHPVVAAFGGESFVVADEIYQFKAPYSRDKLRVLLSIDPTATDMSKSGIKRSDYDFAVSWVRGYGKGRVFYCSLGHRNEIFWNPAVLRHYLDGIQFATGDLDADTMPSTELAQARGETMPLADALVAARKYEHGASRLPLSVIAEHVRAALEDAFRREEMTTHLVRLVESDNATVAGRAFACRQLALIGGPDCVPALAELLIDPELSHMARYALERIPGQAATAALRDAMTKLDGELRIGVINSIGRRGDLGAVIQMRQIAEGADDATLLAAVDAAGKIGGLNSERMLFRVAVVAAERRDDRLKAAVLDALIRMAEQHVADGEMAKARAMYMRLYGETNPEAVRVAGLRGLAFVDPVGSVTLILDLLSEEDPLWAGTAARLIVDLPGDQITREFAAALAEVPEEAKVPLIDALAERGDPAAGSAVTALIGRSAEEVEAAAIRALATVGDASSVPLLAGLAAGKDESAQNSLDLLRGEDVDAAMAAEMEEATPPIRRELARSLGARNAVAQIPALLRHAEFDRDRLVRGEVFRSLGKLAGREQMSDILRVLVNAQTDDDREAAEECLVTVCTRAGGREDCARLAAGALADIDREPVQCSMLRVLGRIGGGTAFEAVRRAAEGGSPAAETTALAALQDWPDPDAAGDLLRIAQVTADPRLRAAAFGGFVQTAGLPSERPAVETVDMYGQALGAAADDYEIRLVLDGLAKIGHLDAVKLAERYVSDGAVGRDAAAAVLAAASAVSGEHPDEALAAAERILESFTDDAELLAAAGRAVDQIQRNQDFITQWEFAGPYTKEKHGGGELFDVAFAPESAGAVQWKGIPADAVVAPGIIDFLKMGGGSNCCCYLVAEIVSSGRQDIRLEMGSDDGLKVWLNGEVIHANNAMRGLTVGSDVVRASLKAGSNILLLKITQGGGDWRVCCRIRSADGFHLEDIEFRLPE